MTCLQIHICYSFHCIRNSLAARSLLSPAAHLGLPSLENSFSPVSFPSGPSRPALPGRPFPALGLHSLVLAGALNVGAPPHIAAQGAAVIGAVELIQAGPLTRFPLLPLPVVSVAVVPAPSSNLQ